MPHTHEYEPMRALGRHAGPPIDYGLLSRYIGAVRDGCHPCQRSELDAISEDPVTTGGFVALIAAGVHRDVSPDSLNALKAGAARGSGAEAVAAMLAGNPDLQYEPIFTTSRAMSSERRRAAVDFATGVLIMVLAVAVHNATDSASRRPPNRNVTKGFGYVEFIDEPCE